MFLKLQLDQGHRQLPTSQGAGLLEQAFGGSSNIRKISTLCRKPLNVPWVPFLSREVNRMQSCLGQVVRVENFILMLTCYT